MGAALLTRDALRRLKEGAVVLPLPQPHLHVAQAWRQLTPEAGVFLALH